MKLSRVLLTAFYAAIVVCGFLPAIAKRIFHLNMGHDTAWMSFGTGMLLFVTAAHTLSQTTKPGQTGKGLMALGFAASGAFCIFLGVRDFFPAWAKIFDSIPGGLTVYVVLALFFSVIGLVGSRRFYRKEFFQTETESAERTHGQKQDGASEEPDPKGVTRMDE